MCAYLQIFVGHYEVLVEPNEDSDRLELEGKYLLVVSLDDVKLIKPENRQVFAEWEYKHLKKYGKTTGKFNLETGRASKTGPGKFIFQTNEGHKIFNHIHGNIQTLGSKKAADSETANAQSPQKSLPKSNLAKSAPKKSHEAPAAIGGSSIPEYAVVDKSKKKKKRSSLMVHTSEGRDVATTTGVKAGVFRKLDENVYDTPILQSIKPKQSTAKQKPATAVPMDDVPGYTVPSVPKFFDSAPTKTVTTINTTSQESQLDNDTPFGDEDPFAGYSVPAFDLAPPIEEPVKVKSSGKNPFVDDPQYDTPMVDDQPIEWQDSKLTQPTAKSPPKETITGDYDVPPELDDELINFSNNPFSNSSNTYSSPFDKRQDYANDSQMASYTSSMDGMTTTTAMSFESDDEDEGAVINPLSNLEDFGQYLETGGDDDMWADLIKQQYN